MFMIMTEDSESTFLPLENFLPQASCFTLRVDLIFTPRILRYGYARIAVSRALTMAIRIATNAFVFSPSNFSASVCKKGLPHVVNGYTMMENDSVWLGSTRLRRIDVAANSFPGFVYVWSVYLYEAMCSIIDLHTCVDIGCIHFTRNGDDFLEQHSLDYT